MAQHLPAEILFHISSYSTPDQFLNGLMLVCSDWFEVTKYEMFWVATLKSCIQTQLKICNEEESAELEDTLTELPPQVIGCFTYSKDEILKERKAYVRSLESTNKILLVNMAPFKKRKETNDDIYGSTYKQRTVQFIKQRSKRRVSLEIAKQLIKIANIFSNNVEMVMKTSIFQKEWESLKEFTSNHSLYDKVTINGISILGQNRFLVNHFCNLYRVFLSVCMDTYPFENTVLFLREMFHYFFEECECSLIPVVEDIIKMGHFELFLDNNDPTLEGVTVLTPFLFPKFAKEVTESPKGGISKSSFFRVLVNSCDLKKPSDLLAFSKFIKVLKGKKLIKFEETMLDPILDDCYKTFAVGDIEVIKFFLEDIGAAKRPKFNPSLFATELVSRKLYYHSKNTSSHIIELLKRVKVEFGISFSHPQILWSVIRHGDEDRLEVIKYLVEEEHVNLNECYGTYSSPLVQSVYYSYRGDNSKEILYLIEKGATITPEQIGTYEGLTYEDILEYYIASNQTTYLPIIKKLKEMVGGTLKGRSYLGEIFGRYVTNLTLENTIEILDYISEETPIDGSYVDTLNGIYRDWNMIFPEHEDAEKFKELIFQKYGLTLTAEPGEENNL